MFKAAIPDTAMPPVDSTELPIDVWPVRSATVALLAGFLFFGTGCALLGAARPQIEVASVELRGIGLLDQNLRLGLCAYNPNDQAFAFRRIDVALDVADTPLAEGVIDSAVLLPPHQSVLVPFDVATTTRNLPSQLLGTLLAGAVEYRLHGSVQLAGSLGISLPFSREGRLTLLNAAPALVVAAGQTLLADRAAPGNAGCGSSRIGLQPVGAGGTETSSLLEGVMHV